MITSDESSALVETPFQVDSIVPVAAPTGSDGDWYCYVIGQGTNKITGMRSGSRAELDATLQLMVDKLNERAGKLRAKLKR